MKLNTDFQLVVLCLFDNQQKIIQSPNMIIVQHILQMIEHWRFLLIHTDFLLSILMYSMKIWDWYINFHQQLVIMVYQHHQQLNYTMDVNDSLCDSILYIIG